IQTPFCTSAVTVQPTEQWVQMLLRTSTGAPACGGGPASALRTLESGSAPRGASPPAASPERRRKPRRASAPPDCAASAAARPLRRVSRSCRLISMAASSLRVPVDPVIGFDVIAFLIARLALLVGRVGRLRAGGERPRAGRGRTRARGERAQDIA